ncbi:MAG: hypothetical protein GKR94_04390 [Gammaproteobacteria bacterium]|nr:hypothetical protein [Gammaproteobacteria bacterium]
MIHASSRVAALLLGCALGSADIYADHPGTQVERARAIVSHGPWPPPAKPDLSNKASDNPLAIALGQQLFFEPALSRDGDMSCATCHKPQRWFTDGEPQAIGVKRLDRNTPTVVDLAWNRWFGWDGANDNLWAQSLRPIVAPAEMNATFASLAAVVRADRTLTCSLQTIFEAELDKVSNEQILVYVGKALAAYQAALKSSRSPFDDYRDAVAAADQTAAASYPKEARRGLNIFTGKGRCSFCHFGPTFTNGEFATVAVPHFTRDGVDRGRYGGIQALRKSPYTLLGEFADNQERLDRAATRHVTLVQSTFGEFRIPGLRNVERTAPYMHDGSLATLEHVVRHYSNFDPGRLHTHGGPQLLRPLRLSDREVRNLVAFLRSLTAPLAPLPALPALPSDC